MGEVPLHHVTSFSPILRGAVFPDKSVSPPRQKSRVECLKAKVEPLVTQAKVESRGGVQGAAFYGVLQGASARHVLLGAPGPGGPYILQGSPAGHVLQGPPGPGAAILCTGGPDATRKEAWPFYRTISGVRLCWELEEPKGPKKGAPGPGPRCVLQGAHGRVLLTRGGVQTLVLFLSLSFSSASVSLSALCTWCRVWGFGVQGPGVSSEGLGLKGWGSWWILGFRGQG